MSYPWPMRNMDGREPRSMARSWGALLGPAVAHEELHVGHVRRRGDLRVGMGVFDDGDGMAKEFDSAGVIGDMESAGCDPGIGANDQVPGEDLRCFHSPEPAPVERAETMQRVARG